MEVDGAAAQPAPLDLRPMNERGWPLADPTTIYRVARLAHAFRAEITEEVLRTGFPSMLVPTPKLVYEFTGTASLCWPLHQVMETLSAVRKYFDYECDDAVGPDSFTAPIKVEVTTILDAKGEPVMESRGPDPRTGKPMPPTPKETYRVITSDYMKRAAKDRSTHRTVDDCKALMRAADAELRAAFPGKLPPAEDRASYAERRRFHMHKHIALTRYMIDVLAAGDLSLEDDRVMYRLRSAEWIVEKHKRIRVWIAGYRETKERDGEGWMPDVDVAYASMDAPVARASAGFLTETLVEVDGNAPARSARDAWRDRQRETDALWLAEEERAEEEWRAAKAANATADAVAVAAAKVSGIKKRRRGVAEVMLDPATAARGDLGDAPLEVVGRPPTAAARGPAPADADADMAEVDTVEADDGVAPMAPEVGSAAGPAADAGPAAMETGDEDL